MVLSVVAPTDPVEVPPELLKTTVDPPLVKLFPAASFACKVNVTALPEATVLEDTDASEVFVEITPGLTVTVGKVVETKVPPMVARMVVAVPDTKPVKVAV